jgi:peroxiredoxin
MSAKPSVPECLPDSRSPAYLRQVYYLSALVPLLCAFVPLYLCALIYPGCNQKNKPDPIQQAIPFSLPGVDSVKYSLSDYSGKIILLHFWADWCPHCRKEFVKIQQASDQLKERGLVILAVNVGQGREHVLELKQEYRLTIPLLLDDKKEVAEKYGVTGLPTSFFIDHRGKVREKLIGWLTEEQIQSTFYKLTSEN